MDLTKLRESVFRKGKILAQKMGKFDLRNGLR